MKTGIISLSENFRAKSSSSSSPSSFAHTTSTFCRNVRMNRPQRNTKQHAGNSSNVNLWHAMIKHPHRSTKQQHISRTKY
ncbi:hypothetical protein QOT17_020257 [Balamuthia mandrillaris]